MHFVMDSANPEHCIPQLIKPFQTTIMSHAISTLFFFSANDKVISEEFCVCFGRIGELLFNF